MKTPACREQSALAGYLDGALSNAETEALQTHLDACTECSEALANLHVLDGVLRQRTRPEAPAEIRAELASALDARFGRNPSTVRPHKARKAAWYTSLPGQWLPRYGLAALTLILGLLIGRFAFVPGESNRGTNQVIVMALPPEDAQFMDEFVTASEILMLALANTRSEDQLEADDYAFNQELARKLLRQTGMMEEKAARLRFEAMRIFLNQLEVVLLDVSNAGPDEARERLAEIRDTIESSKLLYEPRRLQDVLDRALKQAI